MRLIDADKLYPDCITKEGTLAISQSQIANAETVERPTGKWIMNKTSARGRNYTCTCCKKVSRNKFNFCPNCGADMRKETSNGN
ncbi:MAG: hypothetical protein J5715_03855 [Clostridiales bacterium]|nr:hypothetical protein [Clostridiales bacterium]